MQQNTEHIMSAQVIAAAKEYLSREGLTDKDRRPVAVAKAVILDKQSPKASDINRHLYEGVKQGVLKVEYEDSLLKTGPKWYVSEHQTPSDHRTSSDPTPVIAAVKEYLSQEGLTDKDRKPVAIAKAVILDKSNPKASDINRHLYDGVKQGQLRVEYDDPLLKTGPKWYVSS